MVGASGYLTAAVFLGALATIASERVARTKVALLGAALIALFGFLDVDERHAFRGSAPESAPHPG